MRISYGFMGIFLALSHFNAFADNAALQPHLISIAAQEAKIANIGANKYMMLYGINDPLPIIQRWNELQQHPDLTKEQIKQIKELEQQKQQLLQRGKYCGN